MLKRRWYPTCTTLWDGRLLNCGGWEKMIWNTQGQGTAVPILRPEVFDPSTSGFTMLDCADLDQSVYPFMFQSPATTGFPNGRLFYAGPTQSTRFLIPPSGGGPWQWGAVINCSLAGVSDASAVMYDAVLGKVLRGGGAPGVHQDAVKTAARITLSDANPTWTAVPDMHFRRHNHNLVALPDQTVLAVGGNVRGGSYEWPSNPNPEPIMEAEIYDPVVNQWNPTSVTMTDPRYYHSSAALLPDGRVLTAGGERDTSDGSGDPVPPTVPYTQNSAQIFRPAYLDVPAGTRPVLQAWPSQMNYGQAYQVEFTPTSATITKAALTRPCAATHGFDQDQRYVPLTFASSGAGKVRIGAPDNGTIAPPGYYVLWLLVTYNGMLVPCEMAQFVRVG